MKYRELCESAKKGRVCIDDICRGCDVTLCGFDKEFYEREIMHDRDEDDYSHDDYRDNFYETGDER